MWSASFSPDGTRILTGSHDKTAKVWDARTGTPLLELKGLGSFPSSVSYSLDGTRILIGGSITTVWDARMVSDQIELKGHTQTVSSVSFSRGSGLGSSPGVRTGPQRSGTHRRAVRSRASRSLLRSARAPSARTAVGSLTPSATEWS